MPEHDPTFDPAQDAQDRVDTRRALIISIAASTAVLTASVLIVLSEAGF